MVVSFTLEKPAATKNLHDFSAELLSDAYNFEAERTE